MELLHEPPPGFEALRKAFATAKQLPSTHCRDVLVGFAQDGTLFARGRLDGERQARFLSEHLRARGWREHVRGGGDEMFGCHILFSHPESRASDEDPSFIRRAPVELWPIGASHADR